LIEKIKEINKQIDYTNSLLKIVKPEVKLDMNALFERKKPEMQAPSKSIQSKPEKKH
jgi:hypothetical protein